MHFKKKSWKDFLFNSWALTRELIFWIIFVPQYIIKAFIFNCICQPRTNNVYVKMSRHYRKCSDYTSIFAFLATLNAVLKIVSFLINLRWFRKITNLLTSSFHVNHLNFLCQFRVLWFTFKGKSVRYLSPKFRFCGQMCIIAAMWIDTIMYCFLNFLHAINKLRSMLKKAHCKS